MSAPVQWGTRTDVGCVRGNNEDALLARPPIFAVADGMGGHAAGEVASRLAVDRLAGVADLEMIDSRAIIAAVDQANADIVAHAHADVDSAGMGTTVSGVCLGAIAGSPHWFVFNVGDSRAYRFAGGQLTQITTDHSEVAELIAAGALQPRDARSHPARNIVTRSLGCLPSPPVDLWVLPAEPGDSFIVCSDGLVNEVDDVVIAAIAARHHLPQDVADALVTAAVEVGARDNVTVVVVTLAESYTKVTLASEITAPRILIAEVDHG